MSPKSGNSKAKRQAKSAAKNGEKYTKVLRGESDTSKINSTLDPSSDESARVKEYRNFLEDPLTIMSNGTVQYQFLMILVSEDIRDDLAFDFKKAVSEKHGFGANPPMHMTDSHDSDGVELTIAVPVGTYLDEQDLDSILQSVASRYDIAPDDRPEVLSVMSPGNPSMEEVEGMTQKLKLGVGNHLLISAEPGEGASLATVQLAKSLSKSGYNINYVERGTQRWTTIPDGPRNAFGIALGNGPLPADLLSGKPGEKRVVIAHADDANWHQAIGMADNSLVIMQEDPRNPLPKAVSNLFAYHGQVREEPFGLEFFDQNNNPVQLDVWQ